jgi:hypothetical protein
MSEDMPTVVRLECTVPGCGAVFVVPVVYRLERVEYETPTFGDPDASIISTRVVVDVPATLALEAPLRVHLEGHAHAEIGLTHPDDPGPGAA